MPFCLIIRNFRFLYQYPAPNIRLPYVENPQEFLSVTPNSRLPQRQPFSVKKNLHKFTHLQRAMISNNELGVETDTVFQKIRPGAGFKTKPPRFCWKIVGGATVGRLNSTSTFDIQKQTILRNMYEVCVTAAVVLIICGSTAGRGICRRMFEGLFFDKPAKLKYKNVPTIRHSIGCTHS